MKKIFLTGANMLLAGVLYAQTFTAPVQPQRAIQPKPTPPPPLTARDVQGVVPRALRGGNPAQMLNPRAPARYGTAEQSVLLKPDGSGKWNGIKLFEIVF